MSEYDGSEGIDSEAEYPYSVDTGMRILRASVEANLEELVCGKDRAAMREYAETLDHEQLYHDLKDLGEGHAENSPLPYMGPDSISDKGREIYREFQQGAVRGPFDVPDIESLEYTGMNHTVTVVFENGARMRYVHVPRDEKREHLDMEREPVAPAYSEEYVMLEVYRSKDQDLDDPFDSIDVNAGPRDGMLQRRHALSGLEGYYELKRGVNTGSMWILEKMFEADPTIQEKR